MVKRRFNAAGTLDALLGPSGATELTSRDQLTMMDLADLSPTPHQPRTSFDETSLQELAENIQQNGVLQPILVRPTAKGHEIVAGERRWRAAKLAGLTSIPVYLRELDDQQAAAASAVENLMREDLNPVEEVEAKRRIAALTLGVSESEVFARLRLLVSRPESDPEGVTQLNLAFSRLGGEKWESFLKNKARLLNLQEDVKQAIRAGLDYRKALVIGGVEEKERRLQLIRLAQDGASVQALKDALNPTKDDREQRRRNVIRALGQQKVISSLSEKDRGKVERLLGELELLLKGKGEK